jgi:hypothetical protein
VGLESAQIVLYDEDSDIEYLVATIQQIIADTQYDTQLKTEAVRVLSSSPLPGRGEWLIPLLDHPDREVGATALFFLLWDHLGQYRDQARTLIENWEGKRPWILTEIEDALEDRDAKRVAQKLRKQEDVFDRLQNAKILLSENSGFHQQLLSAVEK